MKNRLSPDLRLITPADTPTFSEMTRDVKNRSYPAFLHDDGGSDQAAHASRLIHDKLGAFQFAITESSSGRAVAQATALPIEWHEPYTDLPSQGCYWASIKGMMDCENAARVTDLALVSICVVPEHRAQGLAHALLDSVVECARAHRLKSVVLAARPSTKHLYPLTPIERYVAWRDADGLPLDPWLRLNVRRGARMLGVCDRSTSIEAPVSDWETLTHLRFPESGEYVIPDGHVPLRVDCDGDVGTYVEPAVWLQYSVS